MYITSKSINYFIVTAVLEKKLIAFNTYFDIYIIHHALNNLHYNHNRVTSVTYQLLLLTLLCTYNLKNAKFNTKYIASY